MKMSEREERERKSQCFDHVWKHFIISEMASGIYIYKKIEPRMFHKRKTIVSENVIERG